jgi:hypothetical protein
VGVSFTVKNSKLGIIKLSDNTTLKLKATTVDVREAGFSPFGGIKFDVKPIAGIAIVDVPKEFREIVKNKPLIPTELPHDGWELLKVTKQEPAIEEIVIDTQRGKYVIKVEAEVVMVSRNLNYRDERGEPIYWASWVWKISWTPYKEG